MITRIGNTPIQKKHKASCHCGAVVLELTLPDGVVDPRRCDCPSVGSVGPSSPRCRSPASASCKGRRRFAATSSTPAPRKHYFCSVCGIYTITSADPIRRNMATTSPVLRGVNPFDLGEVPTRDGVHHPADTVAG